MPRFVCSACEAELDRPEPPCPGCGSLDRHLFADVDAATCNEIHIGLKARYGGVGEVKPYLEQKARRRWNHDRQREEWCVEVYDRENRYSQTWYEIGTGEEAWGKAGELSDPGMHGESARAASPPRRP